MFCTECGAKVRDDAKFCEECGTPVAAAPSPSGAQPLNGGQPAQSPYAPQPTQQYQQPLQPSYSSLQQQEEQKKPFYKSVVFWVVVVALVCLLGSALAFGAFVTMLMGEMEDGDGSTFSEIIEEIENSGLDDDADAGDDSSDQGSGSGTVVVPDGMTITCDKALSRALSYLSSGSFSKEGMLNQLEFEDISKADREKAVEYLASVWEDEAYEDALSLLGYGDSNNEEKMFDKNYLVSFMTSQGFTKKQAEKAAEEALALSRPSSEYKEVVAQARSYLSSSFSEKSLDEQLQYEGYSSAARKYALRNCGADWDHEALEEALQIVSIKGSVSSSDADALMTSLTETYGFTDDQANRAVSTAFAMLGVAGASA